MLAASVLGYLLVTLVIGYLASRRVRTTEDFLLAGRRMPMHITAAALFATWYGSETVLGASGEMAEGGLSFVIEDPFGSVLCLVLLALFFIRPFYRMNLLTFGDFYRQRFGVFTEKVAGVLLVVSYVGWIAGQMAALGIILNLVTGMPVWTGVVAGSAIVVLYTFTGGMVSVTLLDFIQNLVIIGGLAGLVIFLLISMDAADTLSQLPDGFLNPLPEKGWTNWINWFAMWFTIGLGSLPQQDIFQRMMSAKSEQVAVRSAWVAAGLYLTVGMLPLFLGAYTRVHHPELLANGEAALPLLTMYYTPVFLQVIFFGALLSAVMSTASGAILAPAAVLSENVLRPLFRIEKDADLLWLTRLSVILLAGISLGMALSGSSIYDLVGESSAFTLVSLFIPMVAGLWWKRANAAGALLSMLLGMAAWLITMAMQTEINPRMYGLVFSAAGMLIGVLFFSRKNIEAENGK